MQTLATELLGTISAIRRAVRLTWAASRAADLGGEPLRSGQSELLRLTAARPALSVADAARELRLAPNTRSHWSGD